MNKISFTVTVDDEELSIEMASGAKMKLINCNNNRFELSENEFFFLLKKIRSK
uniref:hypothetical protein n=1 Tax=Lactococcus fujiensis TaxID=610251 RepID=UPI000AEFA010|nr:hypothetical protein [Lactococcus fujiensis]